MNNYMDSFTPTNVYSLKSRMGDVSYSVYSLSKQLLSETRRVRLPIALMNLISEQNLFIKIKGELTRCDGYLESVEEELKICQDIERLISKFGYEIEAHMNTASNAYKIVDQYLANSKIWIDIPDEYWVYFMEVRAKTNVILEELTWDGNGALSMDLFYKRMRHIADMNNSIVRSINLLKDRYELSPVKSNLIDEFFNETRKLWKVLNVLSKLRFNSIQELSDCCDRYLVSDRRRKRC